MKHITYIILASTLLTCSSCSDFLEKYPKDSPSTTIPMSDDLAVAMTNGCYQSLQSMNLYNQRIWSMDICAGDSEAGGDPSTGTDGVETKEVANFYATPSNNLAVGLWRGGYTGIGNCNTAIQSLSANADNISPEILTRSLGEAYFLRAHYYFILARCFGGVPIRTEPAKVSDPKDIARNTVTEVYDLIIKDCKEAIERLPQKNELAPADLGRATKDAACTQLAKVYLTLASYGNTYASLAPEEGFYQAVVDLCDEIATMGYDLAACDYASLWNENLIKNKNSAESIFEIQYSGENAGTGGFWENDGQASWCSTFMGPRNSGFTYGSYGWNQPTDEFFESYEEGDKRKDITVFYEGCPDFDGKSYKASYAFMTGRNVRKFIIPISLNLYQDAETSPQNFIAYRYADVLLMKAEALNELGETVQAQTPLNIVRRRAGLGDFLSTNKEEMKEKIIHERRMELAFEGHRWFDLIRIDGGDYALKFFNSIGKVNATKDRMLLPIPQVEMDANALMVQNPGY